MVQVKTLSTFRKQFIISGVQILFKTALKLDLSHLFIINTFISIPGIFLFSFVSAVKNSSSLPFHENGKGSVFILNNLILYFVLFLSKVVIRSDYITLYNLNIP